MIVGAPDYDITEVHEGAAFVWHGSSTGLGSDGTPSNADWTTESNQSLAHYGVSVATAGDVNGDGYSDVIVGADLLDSGQTDEGRAYVYHGSSSGLSTTAAWTTESDQTSAQYGRVVRSAGDVNGDGYADVIVGAYLYDNGQTDEGRAFVYLGSASGLATTADWTLESDQADARLSHVACTAAGDVNGDGYGDVFVGAYLYDNGQTDEGRAQVFHGSPAGLADSASWSTESDQASSEYGVVAGAAGDVNGDGYGDVIVSAWKYDGGDTNEGRVFVYHGSAAGPSTTASWTGESNHNNAEYGCAAASAGDVNGDGYGDIIIGAHRYNGGHADEGRIFVYLGSSTGLGSNGTPSNADWIAQSNAANSFMGLSIAAGDVNGDGYSDVIVGCHLCDNGEGDEGRVFVWHGSSSGLGADGTPSNADWKAESDQTSAHMGFSVASAGDVNGDGYSDVIVGVPDYDNGQPDEGIVLVYLGGSTGLGSDGTPGNADWTTESNQASGQYGVSVGTAGDVNGDGYSDVIVGADLYDGGQTDEGRAYVYHGSSSGLSTTAAWTTESDQAGAQYGRAVGTAGDVNGDGYSDVMAGAYLYDNGQTDEGRAFLYLGSASGLSTTASWTAESDQADARFSHIACGTAGDVNGDGYSDVVVGAFRYDNGQTDEGTLLLYYGNGGDGLDRIPRQADPNDTAPVSLLGSSRSTSAVRLKAFARTPAGRGDVRLEWEVKTRATSFDGTSLGQGSVTDTRTPSGSGSAVTLSEQITGLSSGENYHWRVRLLFDSILFPRSPWITFPQNRIAETDFRTE